MTFLSLLLALFLERFTSLFEPWRALDAMAGYTRWLAERAARFGNMDGLLGVLLVLLPPLVVVAAVADLLDGWLLGLPWLVFAVSVLVLAFGPDLDEDLHRFVEGWAMEDEARMERAWQALGEGPMPDAPAARLRGVVGGAFAEAGQRWFGVLFWFLVLGPVGAAGYRLLHELATHPDWVGPRFHEAARRFLALLDWAPARLAALAYGVAGSLDGVIAALRKRLWAPLGELPELNRRLLAESGEAAIHLERYLADELDARGVALVTELASHLLLRALAVWVVVLALMTIANLL
ncbi:MAG TPA: regulatory signaling modulator protein AmpE [Chromatiales bacterium]|nr:regulatory signaling modulator protein AmpE [Chromatiales bacterium]